MVMEKIQKKKRIHGTTNCYIQEVPEYMDPRTQVRISVQGWMDGWTDR